MNKYLVVMVVLILATITRADNLTGCQQELEEYKEKLDGCRDTRSKYKGERNTCEGTLTLCRQNLTIMGAFYNDCKENPPNHNNLEADNQIIRSQLQDLVKENGKLTDTVKDLRVQVLSMDTTKNELRNERIKTRELELDLREFQDKIDYSCPDLVSAYEDYFDKWRGLRPKARECLPMLMTYAVIHPSQIPHVCGIPTRETATGLSIPYEVNAVWQNYLRQGFIEYFPEEEIYRPVNFGSGCLRFFEDQVRRSDQNFIETTFWCFIIFNGVWIFFFCAKVAWRETKKKLEGKI